MARECCSEPAFNILRKYMNYYIKLFAHKYYVPGCDVEELEQECLVALRYEAIEDFNAQKGTFKNFAILCLKRRIFSLLKGNNQNKRRALNESLSLDEDRSDGDELPLGSIVEDDELPPDEQLSKNELFFLRQIRLMARLSELEQEVCRLYMSQNSYDEIAKILQEKFPEEKYDAKTADNALVRAKAKSKEVRWE